MVSALLEKGNERGGPFRLAGLLQRVEPRVWIVALVAHLPGYTMIDQPASGLDIFTESCAFPPVSTLPPLLLCAGQKEGAAAKLARLGEPQLSAEPPALAHAARLFNKTRDSDENTLPA